MMMTSAMWCQPMTLHHSVPRATVSSNQPRVLLAVTSPMMTQRKFWKRSHGTKPRPVPLAPIISIRKAGNRLVSIKITNRLLQMKFVYEVGVGVAQSHRLEPPMTNLTKHRLQVLFVTDDKSHRLKPLALLRNHHLKALLLLKSHHSNLHLIHKSHRPKPFRGIQRMKNIWSRHLTKPLIWKVKVLQHPRNARDSF